MTCYVDAKYLVVILYLARAILSYGKSFGSFGKIVFCYSFVDYRFVLTYCILF